MAFSRGDVVAGSFEVERSLESDDAFDVCRARHLLTGKRIALKVVRRSVPWCDELVARAKGLEGVDEDSLVRCIHQGQAGRGRWYFAFEGVPDGDAETRLPRRASAATAARIGGSIARALSALHEEGFAHGHLRPERVSLAGKDGALKVLDFIVPPERALVTANARYVAPEIVAGGPPSPEADVYALGVILWELLSARALTASESRIGVLLGTLFDQPDPPFCDDAALASWITRMLAPEPMERPEANQIEAALGGFADGARPPVLAAPADRDELDGRTGRAAAVFVVRPPPGKSPEAIGIDAAWRRDVEAHGALLSSLPEGAIAGLIRGRTAHGVALSSALVAKTTQDHAFRASLVAGLLRDGSEQESRAHARDEIATIAGVVSRTPAGVTRLTARLASHVGPSMGLRPSGEAFILASPTAASRPKRSGTLEIETGATKQGAHGRKRKTGEIEIDPPKPKGRGGTLVLEPEAEAKAKPATATHGCAPEEDAAASAPAAEIDEPRRGRGGTLVIEPDANERAHDGATAASAAPPPTTIARGGTARGSVHHEQTRVAPLPRASIHHEDTPTLEIEVSSELVELSKSDTARGKTQRGTAHKR